MFSPSWCSASCLFLDGFTKRLKELLSKLRFKNGPSGKVKAGQEFAYISQCGLYTEPQNVSYVRNLFIYLYIYCTLLKLFLK